MRWQDERLNRQAVYQLVENHREEYDELTGENIRQEIEELNASVRRLQQRIEELEALNPGGVNAPALTETVAILGAALDRTIVKP